MERSSRVWISRVVSCEISRSSSCNYNIPVVLAPENYGFFVLVLKLRKYSVQEFKTFSDG